MNKSNLHEYELINGKPHGGNWYGSFVIINQVLSDKFQEDPLYIESVEKLREIFPKSFEIRHENIIYRPPYYAGPLTQNCTLGIKALVWGRAFKVLKLKKIGKKSCKKVYVSGRRKKIRNL